MSTIKPLPPLVVNQIAAGEVVERPASVVKELLENAIDSGATRVDLSIEQGGATLVRVVDNGCGIAADELPLAVTNHATSKIASAEELFRVGTLGFRGEALASIASVSRLTIRSRRDGEDGAELSVAGAPQGEVTPAGCPIGTTIEVRDLFYNTPVRRKFLRTAQTEAGHVSEAFARVALAQPHVHFTLSHNGRQLHDLPPCPAPSDTDGVDTAWRDRIGALFGDDLAKGLIPVESQDEREEGTVRLSGFVADPTHSRSHAKMQYLLVNGRAIRDRSLQHALGEAYRGLLLTGRKPICFLRLEMPAARVDVNVHPQKLEVRFADSGPLYSQLLGTLRSRFLSTDLRPGATATPETDDGESAGDTSALIDWAKRGLGERQRRFDEGGDTSRPHTGDATPAFKPFPSSGEPLSLHRFIGAGAASSSTAAGSRSSYTPSGEVPGTPFGAGEQRGSAAVVEDDTAHAETQDKLDRGSTTRALQLHNRYLIVETDTGMEVIDQHALHERVLYEQLRTRVLAGPLEKQKLLVPEPVDLAPAEAAAVLEQRDLLAQLGLEVQPFGGDTILVASFPAMLRRLTPADTLREVAAQLVGGSDDSTAKAPERRDLLDELLHSMSCKAAVKYGDPLTDDEIAA
ncbi:MAG: DNA mismatch repair endonuclease MutL, partial [Planctomycetota bacterium]